MTPTARTKQFLERDGYHVSIVEKWNAFAKIRQDLFGFIDILALKPGVLLAIQVTSTGNMSSRIEKINQSPLRDWWVSTGCRLEVHGWSKKGPRGKRKTWQLTRKVLASGVPVRLGEA